MTKGLVVAEIRELELRLGGGDYHLEAVLTRINRLGDLLRAYLAGLATGLLKLSAVQVVD